MLVVYLLSQLGWNSWFQIPCRFMAVEPSLPADTIRYLAYVKYRPAFSSSSTAREHFFI